MYVITELKDLNINIIELQVKFLNSYGITIFRIEFKLSLKFCSFL